MSHLLYYSSICRLLRRVAARLYLMASHTAFKPSSTDNTDAPKESSPLVQGSHFSLEADCTTIGYLVFCLSDEESGGGLRKKYYGAWRARGSMTDPEPTESTDGGKEDDSKEEEEEEVQVSDLHDLYWLSVCLSVCLCVCLSSCLSVCLPVCLN